MYKIIIKFISIILVLLLSSISFNVYADDKAKSEIKMIDSCGDSNLVLKSDGTVWDWGCNDRGQLGNGNVSYNASATPAIIPTLSNIKFIDMAENYSMALKNDGTLWSWGNNDVGQLGDGTHGNGFPWDQESTNQYKAFNSGRI